MHIATSGSKIDISKESLTAKIAKKFSKVLKHGDIVFLYGDIGAGKTFISKNFGYPTFNADLEVKKIYKSSKSCFKKLKKKLAIIITFFLNTILSQKKDF